MEDLPESVATERVRVASPLDVLCIDVAANYEIVTESREKFSKLVRSYVVSGV